MERYHFAEQKQLMMENMPVPFAIFQFVDNRIVTLTVTKGFCELIGSDNREAVYEAMDHDTYRNVHPDDIAGLGNAVFRFMKDGGRFESVYRLKKQNGTDYRMIHAYGEHIYADTGERLAQIWYADEGDYDKLEDREGKGPGKSLSKIMHQENILRASYYDYLTGLPSMTYFFELAESARKNIRKQGDHPVLMYMDFIGMKFYNSKHGFTEGDKLLRSFARLLIGTFGLERCCRIGADHFAVLTEETGLDEILERMLMEFQNSCGNNTLPVHIGVYPYHTEDVPVSTACDRARLACNSLGGSYISGYSYYSPRLSEDATMRQYIVENFETALRERWIAVYLQPIIRSVSEKVCDVEALARWIDPVKGILSPAVFIPALEEAGLIYKLDLYMVDRIAESLKKQKEAEFFLVPHSVNLSRSDFDHCDMVAEITKRVDAAGIARKWITIELTESVIGSDYDFMKEQVERFRSLGFQVWMDDFGSGYSSMDVLQSIEFDVIKFDMSFMKKLDEGGNGKIILTELMRMATSLGVDTVCEGVETESQVRFLQEIGCSKLQGFYYSKPLSFQQILAMKMEKRLIEHENPQESEYYETIGRVNLFDLGVIASEDRNALQHTFSTIPIAVLEVKGDRASYIRSNHSYQEFMERFFHVNIFEQHVDFDNPEISYGDTFVSEIKQCCKTGNRVFFNEKMPDGSVVHCFARRISVNAVTESAAVVIAVLSITEPDDSETFSDLALALAADYYNIFVIDLDTDDYIEYSAHGTEELSVERRGKDFFASAKRDAMTRIYEDDREQFLSVFSKESVLRDLDSQGVFTTTYRLIDTGTPMYVNMKITRMRGGNRIILGISIVDRHMKQKLRYEELKKERETLVRVMALSDGYLSLFTVDPKTGKYVEYSSSEDFDSLGAKKDGSDFFRQAYEDAFTYCHEPDRERFQNLVTQENVLQEIRKNGSFSINYHLLIKGVPRPVTLKAALFKDGDEDKMVVGVRRWKDRQRSDQKS